MFHLQLDFTGNRRRRRRKHPGQFAPDHAPRHFGRFQRLRIVHRNQHAVAEHRDPVANLFDFGQFVRNIDDRIAPVPEFAHDREQPLRLLRIQDRGRLVHQQHPAVTGKRLRDLHHLFAGGRKRRNRRVRIDIGLKPRPAGVGIPHTWFYGQAGRNATAPARERCFPQRSGPRPG